jgi:hypothetical protein
MMIPSTPSRAQVVWVSSFCPASQKREEKKEKVLVAFLC